MASSRTMKALLVAAGLLQISFAAEAMVSKTIHGGGGRSEASDPSAVALDKTRAALELPLANRVQALENQGPAGYRNLVTLMFDPSGAMDIRWRAVTAAGRIGGSLSKPELERALVDRDWYMRNAGLIAMANVDRELACSWARKLLSDKALMVRAAAVTTLAEFRDFAAASLLWEKLYARENFKGHQSLFIRRRIVEALGRIESPGGEGKFVEVLADADESLHGPAIKALERMTKRTFGLPGESPGSRRAYWQQWWKERGESQF